MLITVEKVIILKSAEVFSAIPDNILASIASIAEEEEVSKGERIIEKGDIGDCMYLIADGKVRVHDGERLITELGKGEIIGELAVLDPEPRSATVTALDDALLFRISKEAFDEVMADQPQISQGVIRILCRRLRESAGRNR